MAEPQYSPAVERARSRRAGAAAGRIARTEWFLKQVGSVIKLSIKKRVRLATEYLKDHIVRNISVPVVKQVIGNRTRVTQRSKPGEFPRADTTQLMKTIFTDYKDDGSMYEGFVGTPLDYGVILELYMQRSFMVRSLNEQRDAISIILGGPIQ